MPTFDNERDALKYLDQQLQLVHARLMKVEGESLALKTIIAILRNVISDDRLKEFFEERANGIIGEALALAESEDDNIRGMIDAYVETMKDLMVIEHDTPEPPAFTVLRGGKE